MRVEPPSHPLFRDRADAGRVLAGALARYAGRTDLLVLALPRGGVPVAFEVARALGAPLDVFLVRKLGLPGHEELAMGAIASGGVRLINEDVVQAYHVSDAQIEMVARFGRCATSRSYSWTTGSLPVRRCVLPCWRCVRSRQRVSSSPSP
jgi:predicted phosphoribosyltransferase